MHAFHALKEVAMPAGFRLVRVASLVLVAASAASAAAQTRATTGDLAGRIADASQAVLPGVSVTATNADTGLVRTVTTDAQGRFLIPALPPGAYTVHAELAGFAPQTLERVLVTLGSAVDLDVTMTLASLSEAIVVQGESPMVDPHRTQVSTTIETTQIQHLPTNGRNFISFAAITPGVTLDRTPQQGASATSGLTFAGQRARSNNITVDGLDNNDSVVGAVRAVFSQEAVREFQVLTHSYSAEFGKASGGVVNIVTKSGTNTLAGTVFGFFRDESLNTKEHFEQFNPAGDRIDREKASYGQRQFGGTFGGPLQKDRMFFFGSFERLDIDANNFVTIDDATPVRNPFTGATLGTPADILRAAGFPVDTGNVPYAQRSNQFLAKVDRHVGGSGSLAVRYNTATTLNENTEPFGGLTARSRAATLDSTDHMVAASHTLIGSQKLVNEARVLVAYRDQIVQSNDPTCDGPCDREDEGGPTLEVTGVASVGRQRFTPQPRKNLRVQLVDTLSYSTGAHLFKAGVDFNWLDTRKGNLPLHFGGRYIFAQLPAVPGVLPAPVSAIQAVALGLPGAYVQGYGNTDSLYHYSDIGLFAQDDWRPTSTLTLKLGIRYQNQFFPRHDEVVPGYPASFTFPRDNNNVAPRLAVAWDPAGSGKTTVRAAYGLFYDNHITGIIGITDIIDGRDGVRTLVQRFPASLPAWRAPQHRLPEPAAGFPSLVISIDPGLETPYAHHASVGLEREIAPGLAASASLMYVRGFNQLGTIDYNPVVAALGAGRRPLDTGGVAGRSSSVLQYTSFGETWYRGLAVSLNGRYSGGHQFLVAYTLSKAEDNSTDFQSAFLPQTNGRGRNPDDIDGLPIGFNPDDERGPSLQDQRHRFVASGVYALPADFVVSSIVTVASGRPYNILAGADLNGDGDGGAFPPDRARTTPTDPASSVGRNSGTMPWQAMIDLRVSKRLSLGPRVAIEGIFEVFNLFDRTNYTEVNNIFGSGAYPGSPLATFGRFEQAGPPLQIQLGARLSF
ncbi:MAG: TonB-dependent receptor [Vicinamibacterales bacterium]